MSQTPPPELASNSDQKPCSMEGLRWRAEWIRLETIRQIAGAGLGHYSSTFSAAELLAVLYYHTLRIDPKNPQWPDRDKFLLGKGHVGVGLWPVLADLGYFPSGWLENFGRIDSPLTDHPIMREVPGVDFSSGSLGHNLSVGVGMCLASRFRSGSDRTFVLLGDGELHEGQVWEAAMSASHFKLGNLVAIVDANGSSADGPTSEVMNIEPIAGRFEAFGWRAVEIDGHDVTQIVQAMDEIPDADSTVPTVIVARTQKGKGVSYMEAAPREWHLGFMGSSDRQQAEQEIRSRIG
ncbi:transketolase [Croceicoccus sp. F390]|uniref:Transketolase n=1 Tax=Croceicoccus esteveae TaxID=3075597 RepID=A0ABU2ZM82_9SPHN|nr:transketolase [Croceicoccus sp. F390]MDT0577128.1 transketolase [Croceicoccus sp. F390]